jgi:uncharacterized membrane protein
MRTPIAFLLLAASLACTSRDADEPVDSAAAAPTLSDAGDSALPVARDTSTDSARVSRSGGSEAPAFPMVPGPSFRLVGNEPFWALHIDSTVIRYVTPEDTAGIRFPPVKPLQLGDTLRWTTSNPQTIVEAWVVTGSCSDGMSDRTWTYRASVQVGSRKLQGCAERR